MRIRSRLNALRPDLLAYAKSLTLEEAGAEDLVQDAMLRALQAGSAPRKEAELRPWMFRILKNLFIDEKRKERVRREFSISENRLLSAGPQHAPDPVEALMVRQAFAKLSAREREILCLIDMLGLSYAQAATVIDVPPGTVMSRVSRARRAMIERMGESNVRPLKTHKGRR